MRYLYKPYIYTQSSEEYGAYRAWGIRCYREDRTGLHIVEQVSDISTDGDAVARLAARCTAMQLRPVHLPDVAADWIAEQARVM